MVGLLAPWKLAEPIVKCLSAHNWIAFIWGSGPTYFCSAAWPPHPPGILLLVLTRARALVCAALALCARPGRAVFQADPATAAALLFMVSPLPGMPFPL